MANLGELLARVVWTQIHPDKPFAASRPVSWTSKPEQHREPQPEVSAREGSYMDYLPRVGVQPHPERVPYSLDPTPAAPYEYHGDTAWDENGQPIDSAPQPAPQPAPKPAVPQRSSKTSRTAAL